MDDGITVGTRGRKMGGGDATCDIGVGACVVSRGGVAVRRGRCRRGLQSSRRRGARSRGGVSGHWEVDNVGLALSTDRTEHVRGRRMPAEELVGRLARVNGVFWGREVAVVLVGGRGRERELLAAGTETKGDESGRHGGGEEEEERRRDWGSSIYSSWMVSPCDPSFFSTRSFLT